MIFEEQSTLEIMVYRILTHTQSLIQCQRCQVLIVDILCDRSVIPVVLDQLFYSFFYLLT